MRSLLAVVIVGVTGCGGPFGAWGSGPDAPDDDHERRPLTGGEGEGEGEECDEELVATICAGLGREVDATGCACAPAPEAVAETCDRETFDRVCEDAELKVCDADEGTVRGIVCQTLNGFIDEWVGCGEAPCVGSGCDAIDNTTCVAEFGGICQGMAYMFDGDPDNDSHFGDVPCATGACVAADHSGGISGFFDQCEDITFARACDETVPYHDLWCEGDYLLTCVSEPARHFAWATPFALHCPSAFPASTCGERQACSCDAQCDPGVGCIDGFCDYGGPVCVNEPDPALCE